MTGESKFVERDEMVVSSSISSDDEDDTSMTFIVVWTEFNILKMALNMTKRPRKTTTFRPPCRECTWAIYFKFQIRLKLTDFATDSVCPTHCSSASWSGAFMNFPRYPPLS